MLELHQSSAPSNKESNHENTTDCNHHKRGLVKENGDKVRLVARDFPLTQHSEAFRAAGAAESAREQGKYWEYVEVLMRNQSALRVEKLKAYASDLDLDCARFDSALDSGKFAELVQRDVEDGLKLGVKGTPTIFINGRRVTVRGPESARRRRAQVRNYGGGTLTQKLNHTSDLRPTHVGLASSVNGRISLNEPPVRQDRRPP